MAQVKAVQQPAAGGKVNWQPYIVLGVGIFVGSIGVIFIRRAQMLNVPTIAIVTLRLLLTMMILTPIVWRRYRDELRRLTRTDLVMGAVAGVMFALGVMTGFESLNYTTVLISGVLGASVPLWVAFLERSVLKTRIHRNVWIGLTLALAGSVIISLSALGGGLGDSPLIGAGLAIASAIVTAVYYIVGRAVRPRVSLIPYLWVMCGFAAATTMIFTLFTQTPLHGYPAEAYFWIVLVTLGPQLIVQSSYSYALAYFSATSVGILSQLVTVGNAIAALVAFQQVPLPIQVLGSAVILVGVALANLKNQSSAE
jgi:drug/metabolite transporter (DMT)-like permease